MRVAGPLRVLWGVWGTTRPRCANEGLALSGECCERLRQSSFRLWLERSTTSVPFSMEVLRNACTFHTSGTDLRDK